MDEVQQGRMDLNVPPNVPIPPRPWRNIRPFRSRYISPFKPSGQSNMSSDGSDIAVSPMDNITGDALPPAEMVTESTSPSVTPDLLLPPGQPIDLSPPADNIREEDYNPSPVSSTGLDWEFYQNGSDHEYSIDFGMSEDFEESTHSNSESE